MVPVHIRPSLNHHVIILVNNNYNKITSPYMGIFFTRMYKTKKGVHIAPRTLRGQVFFTHDFSMQYKSDLVLI